VYFLGIHPPDSNVLLVNWKDTIKPPLQYFLGTIPEYSIRERLKSREEIPDQYDKYVEWEHKKTLRDKSINLEAGPAIQAICY
jgi:hypothetical protein